MAEPGMDEHLCGVCGFIYDKSQGYPEAEVPPGTEFENLPREWACPICGVPADRFITVT